jgi:hypothetical protein
MAGSSQGMTDDIFWRTDIPICGTNAASLARAAFFFGPRRSLFFPRAAKFVYE